MSTTFETLIYEVDVQGICTITINRPDKLNALNNQVFLDLDDLCLGVFKGFKILS